MKLETDRLILRKPRMSDWKDVVEGIGDLKVSSNLLKVPHPYKEKDAKDWLKKTIKKWNKKEKDDYSFAIELRSEKKFIGCIGVHNVDKFQGICGTGSWINRKYWKKGYITEAKIAANEFVFNKLKMRKMETEAFADNKASNATQKAVG